MGIAVPMTSDSSLNGSRNKQVEIAVPSYQEVNILFLRYQVMQDLVKAVFYLEPHHIVRTAQKSPYGKLNQAMNWLRNSSGVSFVLSCIR